MQQLLLCFIVSCWFTFDVYQHSFCLLMDVVAVGRNNACPSENLEIRVPFWAFLFILLFVDALQEVKDKKLEFVSLSFFIQFKIRIQIYIFGSCFLNSKIFTKTLAFQLFLKSLPKHLSIQHGYIQMITCLSQEFGSMSKQILAFFVESSNSGIVQIRLWISSMVLGLLLFLLSILCKPFSHENYMFHIT